MTGKAFAVGEAGMLFTNDKQIYERALLWGHYIRHNEITSEGMLNFVDLPCGGVKNRMNQLSAALGLVQLKYYPSQMAEIDRAMNYFCDLLEGVPGIKPIRPDASSGSTKGGWYYPLFKYIPQEIGKLSLSRFAKAVQTEGSICNPGCNKPLHLHPLFRTMDIYGHGKPTRFANIGPYYDEKRYINELPISETIIKNVFEVPWFKHYRPEIIKQYADAYKKVVKNYSELLLDDNVDADNNIGGYSSFFKNSNHNSK